MYSLRYLSRLRLNFHNDIIRLKIEKSISEFTPDIKWLNEEANYIKLFNSQVISNPLLAYRSRKMQNVFFDITNFKSFIKLHEQNLEYHLTRIYRIRNKIVHDAARNINILIITANLKYYLAYSLNIIINSLKDNSSINSIQEVFLLNEINHYDLIESKSMNISNLMKLENNLDLSV